MIEPRLLSEPTSISVFEPYQFWRLQKLPLRAKVFSLKFAIKRL